MRNKLQAAGELLSHLLEPGNLVQIAVISAMIAVGWSISTVLLITIVSGPTMVHVLPLADVDAVSVFPDRVTFTQ